MLLFRLSAPQQLQLLKFNYTDSVLTNTFAKHFPEVSQKGWEKNQKASNDKRVAIGKMLP